MSLIQFRTIVKLQRSISSSDGIPRVLVYNQDRTISNEFLVTEEIEKLFKGSSGRLYYEADFLEGGVISLREPVSGQNF